MHGDHTLSMRRAGLDGSRSTARRTDSKPAIQRSAEIAADAKPVPPGAKAVLPRAGAVESGSTTIRSASGSTTDAVQSE